MQVEREGNIAIIRFARPESLNAIESSIRSEFLVLANEVNQDRDIHVVILSG
jgi:enoyl-CoA hydratase/carnithine racemase